MKFRHRNAFLILFSFLLGAAIFIWLGKVIGWAEIGKAFERFTLWQGVIIVALTFLIALVGNWRWQQILNDAGENISFWRLFRIYLGGYAIMYLFPVILLAGEIFRVYGAAQDEKVKTAKSAASVIIERILEWTVNLLVIFLGLFLFAFKLNILPQNILIVFGIALLLFIFALSFFYFKALRQKSIVKSIVQKFSRKEITEDNALFETENTVFKFFQPKNRSLQKGLLLSLLRAGVMLLRTWILVLFLSGIDIGLIKSLSILGFTYLSSMIPIPASLGSHEVIQTVAFISINIPEAMATAFTMIIRASEIILSSVGLFFIVKKGFNVLTEKFNIKKI
ncbi:MAG: lysylphosphatidylglycerol synthase transmembrane domain-containing protein [Candidatus Paceibacterota bacterium]